MRKLQTISVACGWIAGVCVLAALPVGAEAQQQYSGRSRQAAINYQMALTAERNLYYQHEARRAQLARGLNMAVRAGDMATTARTGMMSRGSLGYVARGVGGNYVQGRAVDYGAARFFNSNRIAPRNSRFWGTTY